MDSIRYEYSRPSPQESATGLGRAFGISLLNVLVMTLLAFLVVAVFLTVGFRGHLEPGIRLESLGFIAYTAAQMVITNPLFLVFLCGYAVVLCLVLRWNPTWGKGVSHVLVSMGVSTLTAIVVIFLATNLLGGPPWRYMPAGSNSTSMFELGLCAAGLMLFAAAVAWLSNTIRGRRRGGRPAITSQ